MNNEHLTNEEQDLVTTLAEMKTIFGPQELQFTLAKHPKLRKHLRKIYKEHILELENIIA